MQQKQAWQVMTYAVLAAVMFGFGCRTQPKPPVQLDIHKVDHNPFGSAEIKQCASEMGPRILMVPEIARAADTTRIVVQPLSNSSTIMMDTRMITDALKDELMVVSNGRVRFVTSDDYEIGQSNMIVQEKIEAARDRMLDEVAESILQSPVIANASKPPIIAVTPALNANLVGLNANSFIAMLRAKIASRANGKVFFTAPGSLEGAEYYLTGEFIAESMQREGMINLVDYIYLMEDRARAGQSVDVYDNTGAMVSPASGALTRERRQALQAEIERSAQMQVPPNVNKHLNVMLVKADNKIAVMEKMFALDQKMTRGLERVEYTLTGNIASQSRYVRGSEEIYIVVTFKLIAPDTKEEIWAGRYETKKAIQRGGVVY
ncbi:MAG TPA: hypothetical protein PLE92_03535 [Lentisphaeria bacterium]|nr:hypothetical protein [Lentisphaerota bacterium]OQC17374.1 MAG: hypothetical protein BWX73_00194 [Lentisphaerae bacterium ADurb.Bin082]HQC52178.1 hypothetical protein [Lentisphaeria bacterium]HQL87422.1 hypothetical protein [Lentisphaeria bacterium]